MKRLLNSIILFIVAVVLSIALMPISFTFTIFVNIIKLDDKAFLAFFSDFFYSLALGIDKIGNVVLQVPLNAFAINSYKTLKSYRFGDINDTISYALAKNWKRDNLTLVGWCLVWVLEWLDPNHMEKSLNRRY
jgi:hypothetical protein